MDDLQKIVLLIDADNTRLSKMEAVLREISTHGRIVVKRAYGNWKKDALKNWENELKRLAIKAEQQFDYTSGKNATDMALVIDTINLLHKGIYDGFVIVASDSDYTPLAINLHESGVYVIGVGEKKTPEAFRNSCDEFVFLENLETTIKPAVKPERKSKRNQNGKTIADNEKENSSSVKNQDSAKNDGKATDIDEIHSLLKIANEKYQADDGYVNVAPAGAYIKRAKPDFDSRTFGYSKLTQFIEAFPSKYKIKKTKNAVCYKCI